MQHSRASSGPTSKRGEKLSTERKRKHSAKHFPASSDTGINPKQQTISDVFSSSQQKPGSRDKGGPPLSPSSKKLKLSPSTESVSSSGPVIGARPLPTEKMYTFAQNQPSKRDVVDLTTSPSPTHRRPPNGVRTDRANFTPHNTAKKLVIKNLKTTSKMNSTEYLNQTWVKLDAAVTEVFESSEKLSFSIEELYKRVENVCKQNLAGDLWARYQEKITAYISNNLKVPLISRQGARNIDLLRAVLGTWSTWNKQLVVIQWLFYYLDRSYLLQQSKPSLKENAIQLFRTTIFEDPQLKPKIVDGTCDMVSGDRRGEDFDQSTFREAIRMMHDLSVYTSVFEPRLLHLSQTYVVDWAKEASSEKGLAEYVHSCLQLMDREMGRCDLFNLDSSTRRDLLILLEDHLIQRQESILTNQDSVADLLDDNSVGDLEQLYSLLERKNLGGKLQPPFERWIEDTGTSIVFDEKEQDQMVIRLLSLKKRLDTIWRVSFHKNSDLGLGLRQAFETFINKTRKTSKTWNTDNSKPGEMIAKYVDLLLRGGAKAIPNELTTNARQKQTAEDDENEDIAFDEDTEVNNQLDQVLDLFRFVHGKAVFEAFYKKDLARRLLMGRSASADAERSMLARLKTECGAGFTQNLEQMFKDVELAREEMTSYKAIMEERGEKPAIDLSVNILSASAWPTYPDVPVAIPLDIRAAIEKFERHYKSKHSGRKLDWKHALAHCQLKARFPKGNKELVVSSFQAVVMLLFNEKGKDEHLSWEYLKAETGLPPAELSRTLQSLACARVRPLTKHPKSRDINETDTFTLNHAFSDPKMRIKINQVQLKETAIENKETHERVAADRNFETQAAIVRIMKSRKTIGHSELVAEVISATKSRGVLDVSGIKKNIDRLIEKEYMEREEGGMYSYIA